jgi:hypothetical protein
VRASSWNTVEVVRPQPGQAATTGTNCRKPMVCSSSWATTTSRVRSPPGSGVSEMRMVSPMPCLQQDAHGRGRGDDALGAHAGLGQAQMQRMVGAARQFGIDGDQILHLADLGRQNDRLRGRPVSSASAADMQRRLDDGFAGHVARAQRRTVGGVLVHQPGQQHSWSSDPQLTPMRTGLSYSDRHFDDVDELPVALFLEADIARIDAVLGQRLGTGRMIGQQLVADVMEVADQRHIETPSLSSRSRIFGTAAALSSRSTVMRTISEPARCSAATWATVASISAVSVLVIDCDDDVCLGCNLGRPGPLTLKREFEME